MQTTFKLPAGRYYVGDICYVFNRENYDELLKLTDYFQNMETPVQFKEFPVWAGGTAYGDGTYNDNHGNIYPVDAGIIGITSINVIDNKEWGDVGVLLLFQEEFQVEYYDGVFRFGDYIIDTKNEEDYEDEYYSDEWYDYYADLDDDLTDDYSDEWDDYYDDSTDDEETNY